jgi:RNA recognition motif-containing protein
LGRQRADHPPIPWKALLAALPHPEEREMAKNLYVGNLNYDTTETTLSELFGAVGEVASVNLITDRMTGRSRGFAFVEMVEESAAQQAIAELDGKPVDGRNIRVAEARPKRQRDDRYGGSRY